MHNRAQAPGTIVLYSRHEYARRVIPARRSYMEFFDMTIVPSFSFRYGGKSVHDLPQWPRDCTVELNDRGELSHTVLADPASNLKITVHSQTFENLPAIDWVCEIENCAKSNSKVIEEILPLDASMPISPGERLWVHSANGSSCRMDDFLPSTVELKPGNAHRVTPVGGRSSNGALPFMNLQRKGCGLLIAVGWSGQWRADFDRSDSSLRIAAGMEKTHLRLYPGEKIRTPRIMTLFWEGNDANVGNNMLRRALLAHYLPRIDGELVMPPVAQCLQAYYYLTGEASEKFEMKALPKVAATGAEAYWIDACWYGDKAEWWQSVGSWVINRQRFPHGLKPISDAAHDAGMKFVLWFEPERVQRNSRIHIEHPEFLLSCGDDRQSFLFNLGLPEARAFITELISRLISENGVDIYRQDFNFDPLPYWRKADEDDRIGMTEIRYVEGHYEFWDELRRRHASLWIDNCSSGGRRIDLETLSRSLPLWPSDFHDVGGLPYGLGLHVGDQCINAGLSRWVPLFGGGTWNFTPYGTRSELIGGFTFGFHIDHRDFPAEDAQDIVTHKDVLSKGKTMLDEDFPVPPVRQAIREWRSVRPFFLGDFYLLLPLTVSAHDWCAWQFHREDMGAGFAMFLRRHQSPFPEMEVSLERIDSNASYEVSMSVGYEEADRIRMSGAELARLRVAMPEAPGSVLVRYSLFAPA